MSGEAFDPTEGRQFMDCHIACVNARAHTMTPGCIFYEQRVASQPLCVCGETTALGVVHRTDGPCFHYEPRDEGVDPLSDELLDGLLKTLPADSDVVYEAIGRYVTHRLETHREVFGAAMRQIAARESEIKLLKELLGDLYLYIDWRYITKQLATSQKELFADVLDEHRASLDDDYGASQPIERWWR